MARPSAPPVLEVHQGLTAQWAHEQGGKEPEGHTVKVAALLLHAAVRYTLWATGQTPE